jgi:methyltransferase (TIGR00027 family)
MRDDQASTTARMVAAQRQAFDRPSTTYGRPEDDDRLQADVAQGMTARESFMTRYLRVRTAFFDRAVVGAIDDGIAQIVVAGAGYDGRSLRFARPGVRWFEVDHPATQHDKQRRLARLGIDPGDVAFVPADFRHDDVAGSLAGAGLDPGVDACFLCEGVLAYLERPVAAALLGALRRAGAPGSSMATELPLAVTSTRARARRGRLHTTVAGLGEPLELVLAREAVTPFFARCGWDVARAADARGTDLSESESSVAFVVARASTLPPGATGADPQRRRPG